MWGFEIVPCCFCPPPLPSVVPAVELSNCQTSFHPVSPLLIQMRMVRGSRYDMLYLTILRNSTDISHLARCSEYYWTMQNTTRRVARMNTAPFAIVTLNSVQSMVWVRCCGQYSTLNTFLSPILFLTFQVLTMESSATANGMK